MTGGTGHGRLLDRCIGVRGAAIGGYWSRPTAQAYWARNDSDWQTRTNNLVNDITMHACGVTVVNGP